MGSGLVTGRAITISLSVGLAGLAAVVAGGFQRGYAQSLLLELGAALLLAAPLVAMERAIDSKVSKAREETAAVAQSVEDAQRAIQETVTRLDEITASTRERLEDSAKRDAATFDEFRQAPTSASMGALLRLCMSLRAISRCGVRMQVPDLWERVRLWMSNEGAVMVTLEGLRGDEIITFEWTHADSAVNVFQRIGEQLQAINHFPGSDAFDPTVMLRRLVDALAELVKTKRVGSSLDLSPVIELFGDQWAVTLEGLECTEVPYWIPRERLREPDFFPHVMAKVWVDKETLEDAWKVAIALHLEDQPVWLVAARSEDADETA
jgi:hypothetical protein